MDAYNLLTKIDTTDQVIFRCNIFRHIKRMTSNVANTITSQKIALSTWFWYLFLWQYEVKCDRVYSFI